MKLYLLFYLIILCLTNPYLLFSSESEIQTNAPAEVYLIMENYPIALPDNIMFNVIPISNSITLLESSNTLQLSHNFSNLWAIPVTMDWSKIPEIGFPKNEITAIHIIERTLITYKSNIISFSPSVWLFKTDTWEFLYKERIPYLENLEFLSQNLQNKISTKVTISRRQNRLGYYQDSGRKLGIHFGINNLEDNIIAAIFINKKELQTNTNIIDNFKTGSTPLHIEGTTIINSTSVKSVPAESKEYMQTNNIVDPSVNTSVDKRDKQQTKP